MISRMRKPGCVILAAAVLATGSLAAIYRPALASSHMDAPLITFDPPANTTDVYAFRSVDEGGEQYLTTALSVYPFGGARHRAQQLPLR